jgi:hypothetical protein
MAAQDYAEDLESDRRRGRWLDPDGAKTIVGSWAVRRCPSWMRRPAPRRTTGPTLRNHILPRWEPPRSGEITALAVTSWRKDLRTHLAASTSTGRYPIIRTHADGQLRQLRRIGAENGE